MRKYPQLDKLLHNQMNPINLENLTVFGELAMRAQLNYARLETERYWPETIFEMDQHAWPADWEGRTMLALTMHAKLSGRMPAFLDAIVDRIPGRLNEKGYIGPVYPDGVTHEQAMSGHSWMVRALVEYCRWRKPSDPKRAATALGILESIIENLYLPQTENYRNYPIDETERYDDPKWILSHKQTKTKSHSGTSDCGCAFIAIDGATAALELLQDDRLHGLVQAMISSYEKLPREALHVQTHATLSGVRGILRYHRITGEERYLELAKKIFDLYKTEAWTDHYANYNWFGLPRWTEPCAIVDSFIISQELWELTANDGYLRDGHHILYNALAHAERCNGAFGTDLCVGAKVKPPSATGGTDSHVMLVDLRPKGVKGNATEKALERAHITCNKNGIPFDPEKPTVTSGVRLGSPAGTTRGFAEPEFRQIADWIVEVVDGLAAHGEDGNTEVEAKVRAEVEALCERFPIYPNL